MKHELPGKLLEKIGHWLPIVLFCAALWLAHRQLQNHNLADIIAGVRAASPAAVGLAVLATLVNYLLLTGYDWLGLRYTGHDSVPLSKIAPAALLSYAISNNTGHAWATGGSVRYRFYAKCGVPGWDILKLSVFQAATYLLGALTLGLAGSILLPLTVTKPSALPASVHALSLVAGCALALYWGAVIFWRRPLLTKALNIYLPTPDMALRQTALAVADVLLSALVMWLLLAKFWHGGFGSFLLVFVVAQVLGVVSQVPGGLGVFESAFLLLATQTGGHAGHVDLISTLLLYRLVYYLLPLLLAGSALLGYEAYSRRKLLLQGGVKVSQALTEALPQCYALLLFLSGCVLLLSGSIPANSELMDQLSELLPLPVIELSHLTGSLCGLLLLLLSRGIFLKIDAAWYASLALLATGIASSLLKGFDWREAALLSLVALLLAPARRHFHRRSSLLQMPFSANWLATLAMALLGTLWLGFFAYRDVEYAHELWWQFSYEGNAPRFLRGALLLAVVAAGYALWRLFSVAPQFRPLPPTRAELDEVATVLANSSETQGYLALLGDKSLFWSERRDAFLMYAVSRRFWIVMGDPVGNPASFEQLIWQFRELADSNGAKSVFYQVGPDYLPQYVDQGLSLFKLGEEARIELARFGLEGKQREDQRSARNKFHKLGYRFELLPPDAFSAHLPELKRISEQWLASKHTREKRFSLGFFDADYLGRTVMAVIKNPDGQIQAFANLWISAQRHELSVDLMRYDPASPKGIMDFLFAELMLWGKAEGFTWFSLGMAPLAGLERRRLAPLWHRIGAAIYDMGDQFYNFGGLYAYKAKFQPDWRPRYLAAPAGFATLAALAAITGVIAGGWRGVFQK